MSDQAGATTYRKKPVVIEAMQFNSGEDARAIAEWSGGRAVTHPGDPSSEHPTVMSIDTLEGRMSAVRGDWIIKGVKGEFYPCKPDIFEATYDSTTSSAEDVERYRSVLSELVDSVERVGVGGDMGLALALDHATTILAEPQR
jgi:hypothetical protein